MTRLALLAAVVAALALARRAPSHRPMAGALSLLLVLDCARALAPPRWLDVALCAAWYCATAAAVAGALTKRWALAWAIGAGWWLAVTAGLLASGDRGTALAEDWRALWAVALGVQVVAVADWAPRRWRAQWTSAEVVALLLAASTAADAAGPWLRPELSLSVRWPLARLISVATWGTIALYQGGVLWMLGSSRSTSPSPSRR